MSKTSCAVRAIVFLFSAVMLSACQPVVLAGDPTPAQTEAPPVATAMPDEPTPVPGLSWTIRELGAGIKPALAIDGQDVVHISWLTEAMEGNVFYTHNEGDVFEVITVATGYFYGPGDMAVSVDGIPYITYHDHQADEFEAELGDVVVASLENDQWTLTKIEHPGHDGWDSSIVVDAAGFWHLASIDSFQFGSRDGAEYATNASGAIAVESIGSPPLVYEFATSIALSPAGMPGITYYNNHQDQLEYAALGPSGWEVEVVDADGDAGRYAALLYDQDGRAHIAYYATGTSGSGDLRLASQSESGWETETVSKLSQITMGMAGARKITSLAIDSTGRLHIAFADTRKVVYLVQTESGWDSQTVAQAEGVPFGQLVELALDSHDLPHLVWFDEAGIKYAAGSP